MLTFNRVHRGFSQAVILNVGLGHITGRRGRRGEAAHTLRKGELGTSLGAGSQPGGLHVSLWPFLSPTLRSQSLERQQKK